MYSLKKLVWLAFLVVSMLLAGIILLGAYQYRLSGAYSKVINQNESALFRFMTIRETITEILISGKWEQLERVTGDVEKLNSEIARLKENKLVSAELKLALVDKIDLTGLAILLRQVISDPDKVKRSRQLQEQLRSISDYLLQYDRIIVGQARERIVNFQMVVIGALGLIISLASFSLILLYRNTVSPLLQLSRQMQSDTFEANGITLKQPVAKEIADLTTAIERLALQSKSRPGPEPNGRDVKALLAETVNETTNSLNGIINYAQLLYDSSDQLQLTAEQMMMLQKIIDSGVHIAHEWQKIK
jgi:nitrate/nitrite-specific signal transduction histidine kinase